MTKAEQLHIVLPLMRTMFRALERHGVVPIDHDERVIILRRPAMSEFQQAARFAGLPEPTSWALFYQTTFGEAAPDSKPTIQ